MATYKALDNGYTINITGEALDSSHIGNIYVGCKDSLTGNILSGVQEKLTNIIPENFGGIGGVGFELRFIDDYAAELLASSYGNPNTSGSTLRIEVVLLNNAEAITYGSLIINRAAYTGSVAAGSFLYRILQSTPFESCPGYYQWRSAFGTYVYPEKYIVAANIMTGTTMYADYFTDPGGMSVNWINDTLSGLLNTYHDLSFHTTSISGATYTFNPKELSNFIDYIRADYSAELLWQITTISDRNTKLTDLLFKNKTFYLLGARAENITAHFIYLGKCTVNITAQEILMKYGTGDKLEMYFSV